MGFDCINSCSLSFFLLTNRKETLVRLQDAQSIKETLVRLKDAHSLFAQHLF